RADRRPRRRDQRLRVLPARRQLQRPVAPAGRQRLAHRGAAAAPGQPERHRPPHRGPHARPAVARQHRGDRPADAMMILLAMFGGTALLLYGIRLSGDSLQRAVGGRLRQLLTGLSRNRWVAVASGATVTAIIQSSAATTLILIGFVSAGIMTFRQTLGIILGADIGTTVTVQLIAFRITDWALLIVGLGFVITFVARRASARDFGQAVLGLGLMFLGLKIILDGVAPLGENQLALAVLTVMTATPIIAVLAAAFFSALVTSSAATIGLALALASHDLIALPGAIAIVLGANIGTCATALASSIGATAEAKRVAVAHIAFKVLGAALVFPFIGPFT